MLKTGETHFLGQVNQKALIKKGGKVLLVKYPDRVENRARGKFDMPGGRLNLGEATLDGLKREVFEEIGSDIMVEKILVTGTFTNLSGQVNFFVIHQAILLDENKPFQLEEAEVADVVWIEPKEFFTLPIIYPEYQEALRPVLL